MGISLEKGQKISLKKENGSTPEKIQLGVGWDVAKGFMGFGGGGDIDLDASCLLYSAGSLVDQVWFSQLRSRDGSVTHSGDNLTGAGDGDDEVINVDLARVPQNVDALVLTVSSFRGQTFDRVKNAYGRVVDAASGKEMSRYDISRSGSHTGVILAVLRREGDGWSFKAVGEVAMSRTFHDMAGPISSHVV